MYILWLNYRGEKYTHTLIFKSPRHTSCIILLCLLYGYVYLCKAIKLTISISFLYDIVLIVFVRKSILPLKKSQIKSSDVA